MIVWSDSVPSLFGCKSHYRCCFCCFIVVVVVIVFVVVLLFLLLLLSLLLLKMSLMMLLKLWLLLLLLFMYVVIVKWFNMDLLIKCLSLPFGSAYICLFVWIAAIWCIHLNHLARLFCLFFVWLFILIGLFV